MIKAPIGDWTDLARVEGDPKRTVTISVVDGFGNDSTYVFDWEDEEAFWRHVHQIAAWLGFDGGLQ